jgi:hypothetical protein
MPNKPALDPATSQRNHTQLFYRPNAQVHDLVRSYVLSLPISELSKLIVRRTRSISAWLSGVDVPPIGPMASALRKSHQVCGQLSIMRQNMPTAWSNVSSKTLARSAPQSAEYSVETLEARTRNIGTTLAYSLKSLGVVARGEVPPSLNGYADAPPCSSAELSPYNESRI